MTTISSQLQIRAPGASSQCSSVLGLGDGSEDSDDSEARSAKGDDGPVDTAARDQQEATGLRRGGYPLLVPLSGGTAVDLART